MVPVEAIAPGVACNAGRETLVIAIVSSKESQKAGGDSSSPAFSFLPFNQGTARHDSLPFLGTSWRDFLNG